MTPIHPLSSEQPRYGYHLADPAAPPVVSVITPCYEAGALLLEAAESLALQSLQQWEWIIVNDGSRDPATLRALQVLRAADPRIHVIDQPNQGPSAARNAGVARARTALVFFLDADNLLAPTALEKLAWAMVSQPAAAFMGAWSIGFGYENLLIPRGFSSRSIFPYDNAPSSQSMLRREAFLRAGGFDIERRLGMEDWEFWARAAAAGHWGADVREYLIWDRRKPPQAYTAYRWEFRDDRAAMARLRDELRARYPALFRDGPPRLPSSSGDRFPRIAPDPPFENRLAPVGKRRVLLLMPSLSPGGADQVALDLTRGLIAGGDRVTVCLMRRLPHGWLPRLESLTSDSFDLAAFLAPGDYPRFLRYLIESRSITHVIICHSLLAYALLPYLRAYCPGPAYLDLFHAEQEQRHGGFPRVAADYDELLDLHIVSYTRLREITASHGAALSRTVVCTTNIDTQRWMPDPELRRKVRARYALTDATPLVLFVGRLSAEKRPHLVLEIIRRLRDQGVAFAGLMVGDGEDRLWLQLRLRRDRLGPWLRMLGRLPSDEVHELIAAADVLLLPSQREGIAVTLYEALASGVVPVAADIGGQRELVTPDCGVLIPHGEHEIDAYVEARRGLLADPERRRRMAEAGRTRVERYFSLERMLDCMRAALDQATLLTHESPRSSIARGVGLANATLAVEHDVLEEWLRGLLPVRIALALRWSSAARLLGRLAMLRGMTDRLDRWTYTTRRRTGEFLRGLRRRRGSSQ